ncbi:MAG: tetratricopeptide repeat protein, partial [Methylococcales bacterium]
LESSIFSLEIAHEHRNYLPMFGMIFMFACYALHPRIMEHSARPLSAGFVLLLGLFSIITMNRVSDWKDMGNLALSLVQHHPRSAQSNYEAGRVFSAIIENHPEVLETARFYKIARQYFTRAYQSDEFNPAGLFGILYLDSLLGQAADVDTVARLRRRLTDYPLPPATASFFSSLRKCHESRRCYLDADILVSLYETALSNRHVSKKTRASLFNELAILNLEKGNVTSAIQLFKQSIALKPAMPQFRFNLIHVLISTGRLPEAREELVSIREQFPNIREKHKLTNLEKMFANAKDVTDYR